MNGELIRTEILCKSFITDGEINNVIKNMDLSIYEGDFTVIMGSSGSGKSTLLYSLSGMDSITSGSVFLDGIQLSGMKEKELARVRKNTMGFVFQGMNLIPNLTVYENIVSPAYKTKRTKKELDENVAEMTDILELSNHMKKFPNQLSGGQRQRTAICRALINHPKILFADEPTGALNSSQGIHVLDIFTKIHHMGQSIVMVTHDLKAALRGNRIIYLKDGRIDGELRLTEYEEDDISVREEKVYQFLKEKGW